MQSDPIGLEGGVNTFGYVLGNPVSGHDFFGLKVIIRGTTEHANTRLNSIYSSLKNGSGTARSVISNLDASSRVFIITNSVGAGPSNSYDAGLITLTTDATVIYGGGTTYTEVALGHELIHANHDLNGTAAPSLLRAIGRGDEAQAIGAFPYDGSIAALDPGATENKIRSELGESWGTCIPSRGSH